MTQQDTLRGLDSMIVAKMINAGLGDIATYTPPTGAAIPNISVLKDTAFVEFGDDAAGVAGTRTVITLFLAEVPNPLRGATITIGSRSWKLQAENARDDSMAAWVVTP